MCGVESSGTGVADMRPSGRAQDALRQVMIEAGAMRHAEGSCRIRIGETEVLCSATVEDRPPPFLKGTGLGWVTAEYGMLPRATGTRNRREAVAGKQQGRTTEIQRLVGRSLRAGVDRRALGERQIVIDCDVLSADGGTRCAAITAGWVALRQACSRLLTAGQILSDPILDQVAAVSCGLFAGQPVLDLDYAEDSAAAVDGNFVLMPAGRLVEVQLSAEGDTFTADTMGELLALARSGCDTLFAAQRQALTQI
jgi:ribonuclease PH